MPGFKKSSAIERVNVVLRYPIIENNIDSFAVVEHLFKVPNTREREEYNRRLTQVKGRKVLITTSDANFYLWNSCILSVKGYDDLPVSSNGEGDTRTWRNYFTDDTCRQHINDAVNAMMEKISSEEGEAEKNSVPSSAPSSGSM